MEFKTLPTDSQIRVTWWQRHRPDGNTVWRILEPLQDGRFKMLDPYWDSREEIHISNYIIANNLDYPGPFRCTGTAIAFFENKVLVVSDTGLVKTIEADCLFDLETFNKLLKEQE